MTIISHFNCSISHLFFYLSLIFFFSCSVSPKNDLESKIDHLLNQMTLEEKVGQMTQLNLDVVCKGEVFKLIEPIQIDSVKLHKAIIQYNVGSIFNCGGHTLTREQWKEIITSIQHTATQKTRLKIPIIYGIDAIHGVNYTVGATLFPQELAQAATWNPELVRQSTAITAYEVRASGSTWNFSPVLDLGRQPLWSRFFETYGEDVFLAKNMAKAAINGYEGDDISNPEKVAACCKHFLGYSFPLSGKDRTPAWIDERNLREYFLPTFAEAIKAGAHSVMVNSGEINGIPVHANYDILTKLLKLELNFQGIAVTDWEDIIKLNSVHHVAVSVKDAVKIAVNAGVDMSMVPNDFSFADFLIELVNEKQVDMSRIDDAVRRILRVKFRLGLFEKPIPDFDYYKKFGSDEFSNISFQTALEGMTLLKNEKNILPLSKNEKILITGPAANLLNILNGSWTHTWQGVDSTYNTKGKKTILQAIQEKIGRDKVIFVEGVSLDKEINIDKAVEAAKKVKAVIICLGEIPCTEKPGDIEDLTLPKAQINLVKKISETGTPIIFVMVFNRPRIINEIEPLARGIVMTYLPGDEGGRAIASTIFGENNPSGKLPFTYPKFSGSILHYDRKYAEEDDAYFGKNGYTPQWDFGFGLSYTNFEYSDLKLNKDTISQNDTLIVSVLVKNIGKVNGKEVVQLYVSDLFASITPSVKRLRGFEKINLSSGEENLVSFKITSDDLAFVGLNNQWRVEEGEFEIKIDALSQRMFIKF